jgi:hypothetical protein
MVTIWVETLYKGMVFVHFVKYYVDLWINICYSKEEGVLFTMRLNPRLENNQ